MNHHSWGLDWWIPSFTQLVFNLLFFLNFSLSSFSSQAKSCFPSWERPLLWSRDHLPGRHLNEWTLLYHTQTLTSDSLLYGQITIECPSFNIFQRQVFTSPIGFVPEGAKWLISTRYDWPFPAWSQLLNGFTDLASNNVSCPFKQDLDSAPFYLSSEDAPTLDPQFKLTHASAHFYICVNWGNNQTCSI